jgi:hypothetical protein
MRTDDFHLERIILIDSYRKGDIVEVRLDGHVNINGINAAGKTTLLRTMPLFYGEAAARMLKGEQGKRAFTDHYLPRTTSYIVFEYARRGQLCMAVLHANVTGESVQYRFIAAGYSRALFVIGQSIVESNTQLLRHVEKHGAQCTRALTRSEYRSIIQNDVDRRELRSLAGQFSFSGSGSRLSHIDRIVTGMFVRAATFRDLRAIIVSSIAQEEGQLEIRAQRDQMDVWLRDRDAYVDVMNEQVRVTGLVQATDARKSALASLSLAKGQLIALERTCSTRLDALKTQLKALDDEATTARAQTAQQTAETRGRLTAKQEALKQARAQLEKLDQQATRYRDEAFETRSQDQERLPSVQAELEKQERSHETLLGSQRSVSEEYERLELMADQRVKRQIGDLEKSRAPVYEETERLKAQCEEEYQSREKVLRDDHERAVEEANDEAKGYAERIGWLNGRINDAQASPELVMQKEAKDAECEKARVDVEQARKRRDDAQRAKLTAKATFEDADRQLGRIQLRLQDQKGALQAAIEMGEAAPGTLIHFLRAHVPGWRQDIGKIASRELLLRTDLIPEVDEQPAQNLYGVRLRLDRIEAPWHAHEETIEARIAELQCEVEAEKARYATQESVLTQAKNQLDAAVKAEDEALQAYRAADECLRRLSAEQRSLKTQIDESRIRAKKQAEDERREVAEQQKALDLEIRQLKTAFDNAIRENLRARQAALNAIDSTKTSRLSAIATSIQKVQAELDSELASLRAERNRSLAAKGIDPETLSRLEGSIATLRSTIERIRNDVQPIAQYQLWLRDQWPQRPAYLAQFETIENEARTLNEELRRIQSDGERRLAALMKQIDALERQTHAIEGERSAVRARIEKLSFVREDPEAAQAEHDAAHTLAYLDEVKRASESALSDAERNIKDHVEAILRAFTKHRGTAPDRFYESYRSDLAAQSKGGREWVPAIQEWFDSRHLEARRVLRDGASLLGQTVHDFYGSLRKFRTRTQSFSRELQSCIDSSADFEKITNVQARIETTVDTLNYWPSIKALSEEFELWAARQDDELPHAEFCQALRRVSQCFERESTLSADLVDLIQLEIDLVENGRHVTVRDEKTLEHVSSNGISYLILIVLFLGFLQRIRKDAPVQVVCAVDELKNLDLANTERLFNLLDRHRVTLISAFPDADPEVLRLFAHRYTILEERRIASVVLDDDLDVEAQAEARSLEAPVSEGHGDPAGEPADPTATLEEDANHV